MCHNAWKLNVVQLGFTSTGADLENGDRMLSPYKKEVPNKVLHGRITSFY